MKVLKGIFFSILLGVIGITIVVLSIVLLRLAIAVFVGVICYFGYLVISYENKDPPK